jgi:hypothetical protein
LPLSVGAGRSHGGGSRTLKARFEAVYPTLVGTAGCPGDVGWRRRAELLAAECEARDLVPRQPRSRIIRTFTNAKRRSLLRASDGSVKLFVFLNLDERPSCRTERSLPSPAAGRTFRRIRLRCAAGFIAAGWRTSATGIARMADRLGSGGPHRPHPTPPEKAAPTSKKASSPRSSPHSRRLGSSGWLIA